MLKYNIKLGEDNIRRDELVWSEKYVAPDLSFVSGVTDQSYHLEKNKTIAASIGADSNFSSLYISCENVTRNGYVMVVEKKYPIITGKTYTYDQYNFDGDSDYSSTGQTYTHTYSCVNIGGVYYYTTGKSNGEKITVKNWLKEKWITVDDVEIVEGDVEGTISGNYLLLDTIFWIENEKVTIDGDTYYFDQYAKSDNSSSPGGIKYFIDSKSLTDDEITDCEAIYYNHFNDTSKYKYVTKFILSKRNDNVLPFDRLSFCTYFYYASVKDNYCPVKIKDGKYVCEVPKRLVIEGIEEYSTEWYENVDYQVYEASSSLPVYSGGTDSDKIYIDRISRLKEIDAYIAVEDKEIMVEHLVQNSNYGDELAIYLSDDSNNLSIDDVLTLVEGDENAYGNVVYEMGDDKFVLYKGEKIKIVDKLCNVVNINGVEYDVSYPNGTADNVDALVDINGENVPMKIVESGTYLQRYGKVVLTGEDKAVDVKYETTNYSGATIDGKKCRVISDSGKLYVATTQPAPFEFKIIDIIGSSLLICAPNFSSEEFTDEFRTEMSSSLCSFFVENQSNTKLYSANRAFGTKNVNPGIGFIGNDNPTSTNDYYNLFDNLVLFSNDGYIHVKFPLEMNVAINTLQENIVKRDFYEAEKEKAINPIVDMEKDVYIPKYITSKYAGSSTDFSQVIEIEVNLHFRTRNLESWKVNEGYNNVETSGFTDNWFITDFYPYYKMLTGDTEVRKSMDSASDLLGLMYFTNDDVFYQKDNLAKSFLRFSYYDSTDPQTQSLLATSTVFVNEHAIYKKYIDNSRKNVFDYGLVDEPLLEIDETTHKPTYDTTQSGDSINKCSVMTEYIDVHRGRKKAYNEGEIDKEVFEEDTRRLSSRFTITNKYATDTSSEGFYLYIFKEYSENLHPKPIYMKIEFNHAGIGRTIPMVLPMRWEKPTGTVDNSFYPMSALTLSDDDDVEYLREGYPLSYVAAQTYIPLYAVYDFKNKEYAYVFDDRYIDTQLLHDEHKIRLNLFELKVKNESTTTTQARKAVTDDNIDRAVVNVNTNQFDKKAFNKEDII